MKIQKLNIEIADTACLIAKEVYRTNPKTPSNTRINTMARMAVSMHLLELNFSNTSIGNYLGKHHSSIIHYLKTHPDRLKYDSEYRDFYNKFLQNIRTVEYLG